MKQLMISRKAISAVGLLVLLFGFSVTTNAQPGVWQGLGSANVDGARDHDIIRVNARGAFTALQLGIRRGDIEFQRVVVHFENGGEQELQVRDRIRAGGKTRVIDLNGNRRRIQSVEFWYGKSDWRTRPRVSLWGRR